jgi:hypothetical protein
MAHADLPSSGQQHSPQAKPCETGLASDYSAQVHCSKAQVVRVVSKPRLYLPAEP